MAYIERTIGPYLVVSESDGEVTITDTRDGRTGGVSFSVGANLTTRDYVDFLDADDCENNLPRKLPGPQAPITRREYWKFFIPAGIVMLIAIMIWAWRAMIHGGL